ncbi:MAG: hypothetical protein DWQ35_07860 [Planctomycetota bacterium]|nr:MAG: hypothetical protein DWQ35_07860 [Planctomycetota bacterium]REK46594.1 MAG: hypothetical protein DWQ46_06905 [Planctomycetota bacterium]
MTPEQQYHSLVESVRLIAASKEEQLSALPDFVSATDEIAGCYGDAYLLVPQLVRGGLIRVEAVESLKRLDDWFEDMPVDGSIASVASLDTHEFWERARQLAADALSKLGEDKRPPNLSHIFWTQ